jgi:hypothetical protein
MLHLILYLVPSAFNLVRLRVVEEEQIIEHGVFSISGGA